MITKWAPTARWGWSWSEGRYIGVEVEGTDSAVKHCKGTLKASNLADLRKLLINRGLSVYEARRITIEKRR
jgi:hypothetical protein